MTMEGSTCGIVTHPSNDKKLLECQKILQPDEFYWDPSENLFEISSMEEEYRKSSNFHRYINIVESRSPCAPLTIQCRDDSEIHEFDRSMATVSIGLDQYSMVYIFISKFRVKITRIGLATYRDKQHHGISAYLLEIKWGIGLDKANWTLQSTTQDNAISALKPLTWRYRTDLLSHRLRRLNCRFIQTRYLQRKIHSW